MCGCQKPVIQQPSAPVEQIRPDQPVPQQPAAPAPAPQPVPSR